jgi:hypothetical protein
MVLLQEEPGHCRQPKQIDIKRPKFLTANNKSQLTNIKQISIIKFK